MDKEGVGRALGGGARDAGRLLARLAEAALAPDPRAARPAPSAAQRPVPSAARSEHQPRTTRKPLSALLAPARRAGGVLWLELTGSFFALLALTTGVEAWRRRQSLLAHGHAAHLAWMAAALFAVFVWFAASSFVRAARR